MTHHLLLAAFAVALTASTLWTQSWSHRHAAQPVYAEVHRASGPGFSGAFGSGAAVRNLLY